jgi:zinc/manganese transport system ATP-binding protein
MTLSLQQLQIGHAGAPLWPALDLQVTPGQAVAVLGANGSGKSSLLRTLAGDLPKLSGTIALPATGRGTKGGVAWLPQHSGLIDNAPVRVLDVARMGLWARLGFYGRACRHDEALLESALELVGLSAMRRVPVGELSGGQVQRLLFARLTVQDCPLILLDEPFSALDNATKSTLLDVIDQWVGAGKIVIAALHDLDAARRFPLWLELARGTVPSLVTKSGDTRPSAAPLRVLSAHGHHGSNVSNQPSGEVA